MLFGPAHQVLVLGPSTRWASLRSDESGGPVALLDEAIRHFETLLDDAWPCVIETFSIQRTHRDAQDHLDLHMRLRPSNSDDPRRFIILFSGVQHLDLSQGGAETSIDYLRIASIGHRGWDGLAYDVHNPGRHILTFYCASFEVALAS